MNNIVLIVIDLIVIDIKLFNFNH